MAALIPTRMCFALRSLLLKPIPVLIRNTVRILDFLETELLMQLQLTRVCIQLLAEDSALA